MTAEEELAKLKEFLENVFERLVVARNSGWDQEQLQDVIDDVAVALGAHPQMPDTSDAHIPWNSTTGEPML